MNRIEDQVLESDKIHAGNCLQGYKHYKDRDPELAKYYWDTLQDFIERKKRDDALAAEEMILDNAVWMLENGVLNDVVGPLKVTNVIIEASVRLKLVRQTKAFLSGKKGEWFQSL